MCPELYVLINEIMCKLWKEATSYSEYILEDKSISTRNVLLYRHWSTVTTNKHRVQISFVSINKIAKDTCALVNVTDWLGFCNFCSEA